MKKKRWEFTNTLSHMGGTTAFLLVVALSVPPSSVPPPPWQRMTTSSPPSDPSITCYRAPECNGTWFCAPNVLLVKDVDADDSY